MASSHKDSAPLVVYTSSGGYRIIISAAVRSALKDTGGTLRGR